MSDKPFRTILADWLGEMYHTSKDRHADGTPRMGKFETEELYRQGKKFLETPEAGAVEPKFGNLTNAERERLEMLAEEAAEIVQACTKILRHGYRSYHPSDVKNLNKVLLEKELRDLWVVHERMVFHGDLSRPNFYNTGEDWAKKQKWTHHQPPFTDPLNRKDEQER